MQVINHEGNDEVSQEKKCGRIVHEMLVRLLT